MARDESGVSRGAVACGDAPILEMWAAARRRLDDRSSRETAIEGIDRHDRGVLLIYAYGTMDRAVGRLSQDEVAFLDSRGAEVIAVTGGHCLMFEDPATTRRIVDLLGE